MGKLRINQANLEFGVLRDNSLTVLKHDVRLARHKLAINGNFQTVSLSFNRLAPYFEKISQGVIAAGSLRFNVELASPVVGVNLPKTWTVADHAGYGLELPVHNDREVGMNMLYNLRVPDQTRDPRTG